MISAITQTFRPNPHRETRADLSSRVPYLATYHAAHGDVSLPSPRLRVATYNVHRWTGFSGGSRLMPGLAYAVLEELDADIIALQEVLRPFDGPDPLLQLAKRLNYHVSFATTRIHRRGELGNALLSRWPMEAVFAIDLNVGRLEQRSALAAQFGGSNPVAVVATHLALVDRTRRHQVRSLLAHPRLQGSVLLLGDMNAWRRCPASRQLDNAFTKLHDNRSWPASYPASRPVLALDRIYARGARVSRVESYMSNATRRGSDHLPVLADVQLGNSSNAASNAIAA